MTERFGPLYASFWEWDDPYYAVVSAPGGVTALAGLTQAETNRKRGNIGRGRFTFVPQEDWDVLVRAGRIVSLYQYDRVLGGDREMGAFLIETVTPGVDQNGREVIAVSGLGREGLLTKYRHFAPVGAETVHATTLASGASGPWTTTVATGAPANNDSITLTSSAGIEVGDELRIELDGGGTAVCQVTNAAPPGAPAGTVQMLPRLTDDAASGNDVEIRKANVVVADAEGFAEGQKIEVVRDSGGAFVSVISSVNPDTGAVGIRDGLPSAAAAGKAVRAYDYSEPTTDDVTLIMAPAEGWELWVQGGASGTAEGTTHAPKGESVWELLTLAAEQSGEFFRVAPLEGGNQPRKQINWYQTADASGMSLFLYLDSPSVATGTENVDIGVIYSISRSDEHNVLTRVYPSGADGRVDLAHCTAGAKAAAAAQGFAVVISSDPYEPDYVEYGPGVSAHGVLSDVVRYGNVTLSKKGTAPELQAAADSLLQQAMTTILESQSREYWDVKCHMHRPLFPGQTVYLMNSSGKGPQANGTFYVLEVRETFESGVIYSYLKLSKEEQARPTPGRAVAREMLNTKQAARRLDDVAGGGGTERSVVVIDGGSSHEHAEFLRVDGSRTLVGDMAVAAGKTIDGVDISSHAADPAAHHAPVTAGDVSMAVSGQAVRIGEGAAGAGLALAEGALAVRAAADKGTVVAGDIVGVAVSATGGLEVVDDGVGVKLPADSGLGSGYDGLVLSPMAVGANTMNVTPGAQHTHAAVSSSDSKAGPGELMRSTAEGDHALRYLTADRVTTPLLNTAAGALAVEPAGALVAVKGNLRFTGGSRAIETETSAALTLRPAGGLLIAPLNQVAEVQATTTLKTAHWASGFLGTGWGHTYDGHLDTRSIYADELRVAAFIADTARVVVGSEYITPGMALLAENFTIPNVNGVGTLVVEDAPGLPDLPLFDNKDWVLVRVMSRAGGGLLVANAWGQVTGYQDGPEEGQQQWLFQCRNTGVGSANQIATAGTVVLGFGKSGAGWWWVTTTDGAGAPYAGITTWTGDNPYADGNRHHQLRMGQLRGVTGVYEWGLRSGEATSRHVVFSDLRSEIHGSRLSLYAGDGAQLRVGAVEVRLYRSTTEYSTLVPNADHTMVNVISTAGNYMSAVDEGVPGSAADYIANALNTGGSATLGLTEPAPWGAVVSARCRLTLAGANFSNDTVKLYGQVFAADEVTPLTSEALLYTMASNAGIQTEKTFDQVDTAATQAQWNGARLRLRWEYLINAGEEAIRLDPQVPSIAVGRPLPAGYEAGGDGFWVGADNGVYKARLGQAAGAGLRWTGTSLELRNAANQAVIALNNAGNSRFEGVMQIGAAGGIWQAIAGTFAAPRGGLKIWNDGGVGKFATYAPDGAPQIYIDSEGQLVAGNGEAILNSGGLRMRVPGASETGLRFYTTGNAEFGRVLSAQGGDGTWSIMGLRAWQPGDPGMVHQSYLGLHVNSPAEGYKVQLAVGGPDGQNIMEVRETSTDYRYQGVRVEKGILVGSLYWGAPAAGVVRFVERSDSNTFPNQQQIDVFARTVNGVQKLYAKFGNGVVRELASG